MALCGASKFCKLSGLTSHAVAKEPSRYAINGILLESNEKGSRLVATDGRRLVTVELRNAGELGDQALLPHRFCRLIDKLTARDTDFLALAVHRKKAENGDTLPERIFAAGPDWVLSPVFQRTAHGRAEGLRANPSLKLQAKPTRRGKLYEKGFA